MRQNENFEQQFSELLNAVNAEEISVHSYCKNYLLHLLDHRLYYIEMYEQIRKLLLQKTSKPIKDLSVIDFGCGNGLLGLYLKFCGAKEIVCIDVDPLFVEAAKKLAQQINLNIDVRYGGIEEIKKIQFPDAISGTDVIEHVYDLNELMQAIQDLNPEMISLFTTASNPENYFKVKKLQKLQWHDENVGSALLNGMEGHGKHISYLQMRKNIIKNFDAALSSDEINQLATATRGKKESDILKITGTYKKLKEIPLTPDKTSNTCDPYTGSWTERILTIDEYQKIYRQYGFCIDLYAGFYNRYKHGMGKVAAKILNGLIKFTGIKLAPYIVIAGSKAKK